VDNEAIAKLIDKFCYLDDVLSADGDADTAVEARIRIRWNKFRQLKPLLTNKDVSLIMRRRLYSSCVRCSMLHGSESWLVRKEIVVAFHYYGSSLFHMTNTLQSRRAKNHVDIQTIQPGLEDFVL